MTRQQGGTDLVGEVIGIVVGTVLTVVRVSWKLARFAGRFTLGRPLSGRRKTDATFLVAGTGVYDKRDRVWAWWDYKPEWQRAAWRWGVLLGLVLIVAGLNGAPELTLVALVLAGLAGLGVGGWRGWLAIQRYRHVKSVVRPAYVAVRAILGVAMYPMDRITELLQIPRDYADNTDTRIVLALPPTFAGEAKTQSALRQAMQNKLGVELDAHWSYMGSPHVEFTHRPQPPQEVSVADILPRIEAAAPGEVVIGLGTRGETVSIYLDTETPHVGANIGTGGGKSSFLRGLIAPLVGYQDAEVVIADVGVVSLEEFDGVPGITIVTDIADIWFIVDQVWEIMEQRYEEWKTTKNSNFRRLVFVLEEGNDFYMQSKLHWDSIRGPKSSAVPPIFARIASLMVKARKVKIHVTSVYHSMDAVTLGGNAQQGSLIRSQYGMKILARFSQQQWAFLVGTSPRPKSSRHPGRAIVMVGDEMRVVQMALWTPEEARRVALRGREPVSVTGEEIVSNLRQEGVSVTPDTDPPRLRVIEGGASRVAPDGDGGGGGGGQRAPEEPARLPVQGGSVPRPPRRYTLAQAAEEKVVPMTHGALRQAKSAAKKNDEYFPPGRTMDGKTTYTETELTTWYEGRRMARQERNSG